MFGGIKKYSRELELVVRNSKVIKARYIDMLKSYTQIHNHGIGKAFFPVTWFSLNYFCAKQTAIHCCKIYMETCQKKPYTKVSSKIYKKYLSKSAAPHVPGNYSS